MRRPPGFKLYVLEKVPYSSDRSMRRPPGFKLYVLEKVPYSSDRSMRRPPGDRWTSLGCFTNCSCHGRTDPGRSGGEP